LQWLDDVFPKLQDPKVRVGTKKRENFMKRKPMSPVHAVGRDQTVSVSFHLLVTVESRTYGLAKEMGISD
jgi:hypothetical protein